MERWKFGWSTALLALILVVSLALTGCTESEDDDEDDDAVITIDGVEHDLHEMFETFTEVTITGSDAEDHTGISLSAIINYTDVAVPSSHQYRIMAEDGYSRYVTWGDMLRGVLVEKDTMTAFPDLPGKYRIRDVVSIHRSDPDAIEVNDRQYVAKQPFYIFADDLVEVTVDNATYTGVRPSDLVNHTGLADGSLHNFTIIGSDGYNQTVNWSDMVSGVLVEANMQIVFPELETEYWVSDIIEIEVI